MIKREDAFWAWVWNDATGYMEKRLVIDVFENGHCLAIPEHDAEAYMKHHIQIGVIYYEHYERIPEPKKRLMTREEILGFIIWNPHIVIRINGGNALFPQWKSMLLDELESYDWAPITEAGEIGEWSKFYITEVEE